MSEKSGDAVRRWVERLVIVLVAVYFIAFHVWNAQAPRVPLVLWPALAPGEPREVDLPAPLLVTGAFAAGFLVAALLTAVATLQRAVRIKQGQRRIASLEQELARLRNLPIEEDLRGPPQPEVLEAEPTEAD